MISFTVDCGLLLRIGFQLGAMGFYRVSMAGIEADITEDEIAGSSPAEAAILLDIRRDARLILPAKSGDVVAWLAKNSQIDLCLVPWFEPVVMASSEDAARAILDAVSEPLNAIIESMIRETVAIERALASPNIPAPVRQEQLVTLTATRSDLLRRRSERDAIEFIRSTFASPAVVRARRAADASHVGHRKARGIALQMYRDGSYKTKDDAAAAIALVVCKSARTVRKWLQGVE